MSWFEYKYKYINIYVSSYPNLCMLLAMLCPGPSARNSYVIVLYDVLKLIALRHT